MDFFLVYPLHKYYMVQIYWYMCTCSYFVCVIYDLLHIFLIDGNIFFLPMNTLFPEGFQLL